jgi:hypothetical protein
LEQAQKEKWERQYQKEEESFINWMKKQWKEVEKSIEERLRAKAEHMRKIVSKPLTIIEEEEGEATGVAADRLARWVLQIPLSFAKDSSVAPPPPPKTKKQRASLLSSLSLLSSSSLEGGRHQHGWTKGPKGRKGKKYFLR